MSIFKLELEPVMYCDKGTMPPFYSLNASAFKTRDGEILTIKVNCFSRPETEHTPESTAEFNRVVEHIRAIDELKDALAKLTESYLNESGIDAAFSPVIITATALLERLK